MARLLTASSLQSADIGPAFTLIQALYPQVTLDRWRSFATPLVRQLPGASRGLVGIRNESGYLCGLFAYRVEADLEHDRALVVDIVAALDIFDTRSAIQAIVESLRSMAERLSCNIARIRVTHTQQNLGSYLTSHDFAGDGLIMTRRISEA
jgi:hypothetical protein